MKAKPDKAKLRAAKAGRKRAVSSRPKGQAPTCAGGRVHPFLKEYLGYCFYKAAFQVRARVDLELAPFGVVAPQFGMLTVLNSQGPLTQGELGLYMAMDKATMVRMVDGLEAKGWLKRVPSQSDRRANLLQVTPGGRTAMRAMDQARKRAEREFLKPLSAVERLRLKAIVIKLVR